MTGTYQEGVTWVLFVVFAGLFAISVIEVVCELFDLPSISSRVERWSLRNQWFAGGLILVVAMLLAHFFLNPLEPPKPPV
jgi:hypothetical protein